MQRVTCCCKHMHVVRVLAKLNYVIRLHQMRYIGEKFKILDYTLDWSSRTARKLLQQRQRLCWQWMWHDLPTRSLHPCLTLSFTVSLFLSLSHLHCQSDFLSLTLSTECCRHFLLCCCIPLLSISICCNSSSSCLTTCLSFSLAFSLY